MDCKNNRYRMEDQWIVKMVKKAGKQNIMTGLSVPVDPITLQSGAAAYCPRMCCWRSTKISGEVSLTVLADTAH